MALYQVFLHGGIVAGIEVSDDGIITRTAPVLRFSVGMSLQRLRQWVKGKRGEIILVEERR